MTPLARLASPTRVGTSRDIHADIFHDLVASLWARPASRCTAAPARGAHYLRRRPDPRDEPAAATMTDGPSAAAAAAEENKGKDTDETTAETPQKTRRNRKKDGSYIDVGAGPYSIVKPEDYAGHGRSKLRRMTRFDTREPLAVETHTATRPLLLTMDAFDTLITPRQPVPEQYRRIAHKHGLLKLKAPDIASDFRESFQRAKQAHPNYGKSTGKTPKTWWTGVIMDTFPRSKYPDLHQDVRARLADELYHRFSSSKGYNLFPDVFPFLEAVGSSFQATRWAPRRTLLGVLSNSDPRVRDILNSFQIAVKPALYPPRFAQLNRYQRGLEAKRARPAFATLSYEAGVQKPDVDIFQHALNDANQALLSLHTVARLTRSGKDLLTDVATEFHHMHIGDSLCEDVLPAIRAGWDGVWLDRSSDAPVRELVVDASGNILQDSASSSEALSDPPADSDEHFVVTAVNSLAELKSVVTRERLEGVYVDAETRQPVAYAEADKEKHEWVPSRLSQLGGEGKQITRPASRRATKRNLGLHILKKPRTKAAADETMEEESTSNLAKESA